VPPQVYPTAAREFRQAAISPLTRWREPFTTHHAIAFKKAGGLPMNQPAMAKTVETPSPRIELPLAPDRRRLERVLIRLPIRILGIDNHPVCYGGVCTNLSRGGVGLETPARLEVGRIIEFEFVQVTDEVVRYWVRITFRHENRYGEYYVDDDGSDIRAPT
jgi:hypothetical protein